MQRTSSDIVENAGQTLKALKKEAPRVHCLTNGVAQSVTANILLALGAQPSMTWSALELPDFIDATSSLLINLGTLEPDRFETALSAARMADRTNKSFVLDPVYAERSPKRLKLARKIMEHHPDIIRGNASELTALDMHDAKLVRAESGAIDQISDHAQRVLIHNGSTMLTYITAMGCALGAVMAACLAVEDEALDAALSASLIFGVAAEQAEDRLDDEAVGPGSFLPAFLDALFLLTPGDLKTRARLEVIRHG